MPNRRIVARELGGLLKVLSHPDRIQIIQLLASHGEHSVNSIAEKLDLPPARVSQHLSELRNKRLVVEKPQGRARFYGLTSESLAWWLVDGVSFIAGNVHEVTDEQIEDARNLWVGEFSSNRLRAANE